MFRRRSITSKSCDVHASGANDHIQTPFGASIKAGSLEGHSWWEKYVLMNESEGELGNVGGANFF